MASAEEVHDFYQANFSRWNEYAATLDTKVKAIAKSISKDTVVDTRVKTAVSSTRKILITKPGRAPNSLGDFVGTRVVCSTGDEVAEVVRCITGSDLPCERVDKKEPSADKLEYLGTHIDLSDPVATLSDGSPIRAEIQVRTRAQDAWATMSHRLGYKNESVPNSLRRRVTRLIALVEIFDDEVDGVLAELESDAEAVKAMGLRELADIYESLLGTEVTTSSRSPVFDELILAYGSQEDPMRLITLLVEREGPALAKALGLRGPGGSSHLAGRDWLLGQPESLILAERAANKPMKLSALLANSEMKTSASSACAALGHPLPAS